MLYIARHWCKFNRTVSCSQWLASKFIKLTQFDAPAIWRQNLQFKYPNICSIILNLSSTGNIYFLGTGRRVERIEKYLH